MKAPRPLEADVQQGIVQAILRVFDPIDVRAVPNAGKRGRGAQAQIRKEGVKAGTPDLIAVWPGGVGFIETKRPGWTPCEVSAEQRELHDQWRSWGHNVGIAASKDDALALLVSWGAPRRKSVVRPAMAAADIWAALEA